MRKSDAIYVREKFEKTNIGPLVARPALEYWLNRYSWHSVSTISP
jgi:hypothetical protein